MLDEKKVIADKLVALSFFGIVGGFLLGLGLCLGTVTVATKGFPGSGLLAFVLIVISIAFAIFGDCTHKQIREFINRPYVGDLEKNDVDTPADRD